MRRALRRIGRGVRVVADRAAECRYGLRSRESIALEDLGLATENGQRIWHHPSEWISVSRALRRLGAGPDDVLADIGSGMGRAVVLAARLPVRRVIGVELSPQLSQVAEQNVARNRDRLRCGDVRLEVADAAQWEVPDDLTIAYMYCPFTGDVFQRVLDNLLESVQRRPRLLRLVYNYPVEHDRVIAGGRARPLHVAPSKWPHRQSGPADVIVTYALLPTEPSAALERDVARASGRVPMQWLGPYDPGFELDKPAIVGAGQAAG